MIEELLTKIAALQCSGDRYYKVGHFPSYRYYPYLNLRREDDNFFYTALTLSLLKMLRPFLREDLQNTVQLITQQAVQNYQLYQVREEDAIVYQFWRVGKHNHFPNGLILKHFRKFKSPPDTDDTALGYLTYPHTFDEVIAWKEYLKKFANGYAKTNRKLAFPFKPAGVYSTWMGTGRMPIEFDVVVMCNTLRVFLTYGTPLEDTDLATLEYVRRVLRTNYYLRAPFFAAPWYPSAIVIHYHLVKFFTDFKEFATVNDGGLLRENTRLMQSEKHLSFLERILLNVAAFRLGLPTLAVRYDVNWEIELKKFSFYIGGMLTATTSPSLWQLAKYPIFHWQFKCFAFYYSLVVEYEIW